MQYMLESITLGIGRKSLLILDNLGISAEAIRSKLNGVGIESASVAQIQEIVAEIAKERTAEMGEAYETVGVKIGKIKSAFANMREEISKKLFEGDERVTQYLDDIYNTIMVIKDPVIGFLVDMGKNITMVISKLSDLALAWAEIYAGDENREAAIMKNMQKSLPAQMQNNTGAQNQKLLSANVNDMVLLKKQRADLEEQKKNVLTGKDYSGFAPKDIYRISKEMGELDKKIAFQQEKNNIILGAINGAKFDPTKKDESVAGRGGGSTGKTDWSGVLSMLKRDMADTSEFEKTWKETTDKMIEDNMWGITKMLTEEEARANMAAEEALANQERYNAAVEADRILDIETKLYHYQLVETIVSDSMSFMANTISLWKNQSLDTFQKVIGSLQGAGQGIGSIGSMLGLSAATLNPIAIATAAIGGVGAIYSALKSDSSSSTSSAGGYTAGDTASNRTTIQRTGPETVYNTYNNTINTQYTDTAGFREFARALAAEMNKQGLRTAW
jgi:hypothetical protein